MSHNRFIGMLFGLGMLSACGEGSQRALVPQNDNGTDVSLNIEDGNASVSADGDGASVAVDLPGITGSFKLPKLKIQSDEVDIDGVGLYPGAHVTGIDLNAQDGSNKGSLTLRFETDAAPAAVQKYYLDAFKANGVTAQARGSGVAGSDHEGKPFAIDLRENKTAGGTRGVLTFGSAAG